MGVGFRGPTDGQILGVCLLIFSLPGFLLGLVIGWLLL
jgi:hypothetical protein